MDSRTSRFDGECAEGMAVGLDGHVLTIRLDRPEKRNAITYDMYVAMTALLDRAATDERVRCVLFRATGAIFSAGHDVGGFARGLSLAVEEKPSFGFMRALAEFPKPVIAALNGDAVGIGATMLFHCDLVYAVPGAGLVFPFMRMGLVPEFASTFYLPRLIGHRRATELFLRDGQCPVERAVEWGIVNELVQAAELDGFVARATAEVAALSPEAVREAKRLMKEGERDAVRDAIASEAHSFHALLKSDFVRERLGAVQRGISRNRMGDD